MIAVSRKLASVLCARATRIPFLDKLAETRMNSDPQLERIEQCLKDNEAGVRGKSALLAKFETRNFVVFGVYF